MTAAIVNQSTTQPLIPQLRALEDAVAPFGEPLLRAAIGLTLVPHGAQKLFGAFGGYGLEGTGQWLASIGFEPGYLFALAIGLLEVAGGIMLAAGLLTRPVAMAVAIFMVTAITIHWPNGYFWINQGGGWEVPLIWGAGALFFALRGGGAYSVDRLIGKEI